MMRALFMIALLPLGTAQNSGKPAMAPFVADDSTKYYRGRFDSSSKPLGGEGVSRFLSG